MNIQFSTYFKLVIKGLRSYFGTFYKIVESDETKPTGFASPLQFLVYSNC